MSSTALLVIDIQRGAFDGVRCPPIDAAERFVGNAQLLVEAARAGGHPIVFVQHCESDPRAPFEEGSVHWQLHESLQPQGERESTLRKYAFSAFENTDLDARLKAQGLTDLVICGLQSEYCVSHATQSALQLGYRVQLAQDGHSTWPTEEQGPAEIRDQVNATLAAAGASLASSAELAARLAKAKQDAVTS
ncbi:isochorismatase family protein [Roseateles sp. DAIF2]|uniref:isochorismatase family protein n=1 Tax=Roseateles sp. DAIF2 TaxID=2714952 RepID=UPI0018A2F618|nr:isochorismatase family protein [Roseateles sp. DAIF2]QPF71685.1 isochorismatase family protein [Roseateles sp. DAIF2]